MDDPDTSTNMGPTVTRRRSRRARPSGSLVDIGGLTLEVQATNGPHRDVLTRLLGGLPPGHAPADARFEFSRRPVVLPDRAPDERYPDESSPEISVWHERESLFLHGAHQDVRVRVDADRIRVSCVEPSDELGLRQLFQHITTHVLVQRGGYVVHGGALRRGDHVVLALGYSGAGKSTLALAALEHGWSVMSDDLVTLRSDGDLISIQGVPKPLALPSDLGAASLDDAPALEWDARRRRHVGADRLDLRAAPLAQILVVGHADGATARVEPVERDEVVSLLLSSFAAAGDPAALRRFFPVAVATARVPCARLRHSDDPARRLTEAARALDEVTDHPPEPGRPTPHAQ